MLLKKNSSSTAISDTPGSDNENPEFPDYSTMQSRNRLAGKCPEAIQANSKHQFLNSQQIQMTEGPKGNTQHKALNPKQTQSTNDQVTKTFRFR